MWSVACSIESEWACDEHQAMERLGEKSSVIDFSCVSRLAEYVALEPLPIRLYPSWGGVEGGRRSSTVIEQKMMLVRSVVQ